MRKKILFISTLSPASNPRIVKEMRLAGKNFDVDFIGFCLDSRSMVFDKTIMGGMGGARFDCLSASRKPFAPWLMSTLMQVFARVAWRVNPGSLLLTAIASDKRTFLLMRRLRAIKDVKYDFVIAHTLGAIYPAYRFARKRNLRFSYDAEDYDPGVAIESYGRNEKKRRESLLKMILPACEYVSYASPLIREYTRGLAGIKGAQKDLVVNNAFPLGEFCAPSDHSLSPGGKARFVWFSQNIGPARGLEMVIDALSCFKESVSLTLIGNVYRGFEKEWIRPYADLIEVLQPMPQAELHRILSSYDVGLAVEASSADLNRQIALTNKIFAYYQAGLFILATDTPAQKGFLADKPGHGIITAQDRPAVKSSVENILENLQRIREEKNVRYCRAKDVSWENEAKKLERLWESILCDKKVL